MLFWLFFGVLLSWAEDIPPDLKPWVPWLLAQHPAKDCITDSDQQNICNWMGKLNLQVATDGASFQVQGQLDKAESVQLVGSAGAWPINVRDNGTVIPVTERNGKPFARLDMGLHDIRGDISWPQIPPTIQLPKQIGIVQVLINGQKPSALHFTPSNQLILSATSYPSKPNVALQVSRRITDGIPIKVETHISIQATGSTQQLNLGEVELQNSTLTSVQSHVTTWRNDKNERLVRLPAGKHSILLSSTISQPTTHFLRTNSSPLWPQTEQWIFVANPQIRTVYPQNTTLIEDSQDHTPKDWQGTGPFHIVPSVGLQLYEAQRGSSATRPNSIHLSRTIIMNSQATEYRIQDRFSGTINQGWRFSAKPDVQLKKALSHGKPQLISTAENGMTGIELREQSLALEVHSVRPVQATLDNIGWNIEVQSLHTTILLPVGWKALYLSGVDKVYGSVADSWSYWKLLLLLCCTLLVYRSNDWMTALASAIALAITATAQPWLIEICLFAFITLGFLRGKMEQNERLHTWYKVMGLAFILFILWIIAIQLPTSFAPALHHSTAQQEPAQTTQAFNRHQQQLLSHNTQLPSSKRVNPKWTGQKIYAQWYGKQRNAPLSIHLVSPQEMIVLQLIATLSFLFMLWRYFGGRQGYSLLLVILFLLPSESRAEIPSQTLQEDLTKFLLQKEACEKDCSTAPLLHIKADSTLVMHGEIHAAGPVMWPIPGPVHNWRPDTILINGKETAVFRQHTDGFLYLRLNKGVWQFELEGPLQGPLSLHFLQPAKQVDFTSKTWQVEGIRSDKSHLSTIFLHQRSQQAVTPPPSATFLLQREFFIGPTWQLKSTLTRLHDRTQTSSLRIPLLNGETLPHRSFALESGNLTISLPQDQTTITWMSNLSPQANLELKAPLHQDWLEEWSLRCHPSYSCRYDGLTPVSHYQNKKWQPTWRPWPGETVRLSLNALQTTFGSQDLIEEVNLEIDQRVTYRQEKIRIALDARETGSLQIQLPNDADMKHIQLNHLPLTDAINDDTITIPFTAGKHSLIIQWHRPNSATLLHKTSLLQANYPLHNIHVQWNNPSNYAIFWLHGPGLGSYSLLPLYLLAIGFLSLFMARLASSPLTFGEWIGLFIGTSVLPLNLIWFIPIWILWISGTKETSFSSQTATMKTLHLTGLLVVFLLLIKLFFTATLQPPTFAITAGYNYPQSTSWFVDQTTGTIPQAIIVSIPIVIWRVLMLIWTIWFIQLLYKMLSNRTQINNRTV